MMIRTAKESRIVSAVFRGLARQLKRILAFGGLVALVVSSAIADSPEDKVNRVKAAFVFNIAKFVSWPESAYSERENKLVICFYQRDSIGQGFDSIQGKKIHGRPVEKAIIKDLSESAQCDIVFIPSLAFESFLLEFQGSPQSPVLTVADLTDRQSSATAYPGVMLNLIRQGASMGFEVNLLQVSKQGLEMSSELLKLARIVSAEN